jgi:Domain of unknown function (DUF4271)
LQPKHALFLKNTYLFILFFFLLRLANAQQPDSTLPVRDTLSVNGTAGPQKYPLQKLLDENSYLNSKGTPETLAARPRTTHSHDALFYVLALLIFIFGILRTVYTRYFSTIFRVFFNSSLRQSQLTDQLLQSKLPSLFYNTIFLAAGGLYIYLLLQYLNPGAKDVDWKLLLLCVTIFAAVYFVKYLTLKFTGWVFGYQEEADTYIFIVFLINKIIGICLLPVLVVLSFSLPFLANIFVVISLLFIGVMTLMRFFRSYGFLQNRLKVSRFHFFLYIFSLEILPLLIMYRAAELFIIKNL